VSNKLRLLVSRRLIGAGLAVVFGLMGIFLTMAPPVKAIMCNKCCMFNNPDTGECEQCDDCPNPTSGPGPTAAPTSSCFPAATMVLMGDQTERKIEEVKVGDKVESQSEDGNKSISTVTKLEQPISDNLCQINFINGERLRLTSQHPVFTQEGWKAIDIKATVKEIPNLPVMELKKGDKIVKANGTMAQVNSFACWSTSIQTYNLRLDGGAHTYFAGGFLVHNKGSLGRCSMDTIVIQGASKDAHGTYILTVNQSYTISTRYKFISPEKADMIGWLGYNPNSINLSTGVATGFCDPPNPNDGNSRDKRGQDTIDSPFKVPPRNTLWTGTLGSGTVNDSSYTKN
jgi:hypothetical protein